MIFFIFGQSITKVFCILVVWILINSTNRSAATEEGSSCIVQNSRRLPGVCTNLRDCPLALGAMRVGIMPTKCSVSPGEILICCRTVKRISRQKCEEYSAVFRDTKIETEDTKVSVYSCPVYLRPYISGGQDAEEGEFPHQAAIGYDVREEEMIWRCGGTLIAPDFVMTAGRHQQQPYYPEKHGAAHCISGSKARPVKVLLGDIRLPKKNSPPGSHQVEIPIANITVHPNYYPPLQYNDIAIIKLAYSVNISKNIFPACLPQAEYRFDKLPEVKATGWGKLGAFEQTSQVLQYVTIRRFGSIDCNTYFDKLLDKKSRLPEGIIPSQFCAGDKVGQKDTCQGDSGGPITVHKDNIYCIYYAIGITSFGSSLCGYQQPGVYTNVQAYLDWIEDIVWPKHFTYPYENITNPIETGQNKYPDSVTTTTTNSEATTQSTTTATKIELAVTTTNSTSAATTSAVTTSAATTSAATTTNSAATNSAESTQSALTVTNIKSTVATTISETTLTTTIPTTPVVVTKAPTTSTPTSTAFTIKLPFLDRITIDASAAEKIKKIKIEENETMKHLSSISSHKFGILSKFKTWFTTSFSKK